MSVINKMLRDLDARQGAGREGGGSAQAASSGLVGTVSVKESRSPVSDQRSSLPMRELLTVLLLVTVVGGAGYALSTGSILNRTFQARVPVVAQPAPILPVTSIPAPTPTPTLTPASASASAPTPVASAGVEAQLPGKPSVAESPVSASKLVELPVIAAEPIKPLAATVPTRSVNAPNNASNNIAPAQLLLESALRTVPTSLGPIASSVSPVNADRVVPVQAQPSPLSSTSVESIAPNRLTGSASSALSLRQTAVQETLVQAQSLWASGSRSAALDLMREAVAVSERAQSGLAPEVAASVLAPLVRELARMELAEGRVSAVLEMLTRLESPLSNQADLWAVRGNVAQRLTRHAESVRAYQMALKLRPGEPRWMLGAAVSLAAQGQLTESAELAESARAIGAVSPEILAYLRQVGVALR